MSLAIGEWLQTRTPVLYQGWTMVFVSSVCIAFVFASSTASMPLIYGPVIDEFGWSRTQATLLFTYKNVASAVAALFCVGPLCERFGLRRVTVTAFALTAAGMSGFLWVDSLWSYYVAGIVLGFGVAATFVTAKILVSRWFVRNQGLALGVMLAGTSVGGLLFPMAYTLLNDAFGWRIALASLSLGIWGIALPLYLTKANENPSEEDLRAEADCADRVPAQSAGWRMEQTFGDLLRTRMFWLIALSFFLIAAADAGLMQHTVLYLERDAGMPTAVAAAAISMTLGLGIVAKVGAGWFYDRLSIRGVTLWYLLLAVSILLAFTVTGALTLVLFASMRGIAHGGLMSEPAVIAKHCYGPRFLNMTIPVFLGIWAIGAAFGPVLLSLLYDLQGTYRNGFVLLIGCCLLAALTLSRVRPLFARPPRVAPRSRPV